ncbi:MAG TPA: hypothetical protein VLE49_21365 [Anaerolineales bacterium]|nr:hypothetical protein [Anaerolineales bacterium]
MAEEQDVRIIAWPTEPAQLSHRFEGEQPCPVSIAFNETPAHVILTNDPKQPLAVDMDMLVRAREPIPFCIKVCEPICAESNYTIGINIFDNPFASITVRGLTRLFNCQETPPGERTCVSFVDLPANQEYPAPFAWNGLNFIPLKNPLRASTIGDPQNVMKLAFPPSGMRIEFPGAVSNVTLTVNNYAGPSLDFAVYSGGNLLEKFTEPIANEVKTLELSHTGVTAVEISGGDNESALVEVCYSPVIVKKGGENG